MIWRDCYGAVLCAGDIIEDLDQRVIGKVVFRNGCPEVLPWKWFMPSTMNYVPAVDCLGNAITETRRITGRHTKLGWAMRGHRMPHVEVLKREKK